MEAELKQCEADTAQQLRGVGLPDLAAAEAMLAAEQEHMAGIERLQAQLDGLVGKEPAETLPELRDAAALEIEQKGHALEALGPIAQEPRARERLEVEVRDLEAALERARDDEANARARVDTNPVDAEAGRRPRRAARHVARGAGRAPAPDAGLRADAPRDRGRRAGHDEDRDALPRGDDGRATSPGSPRAATAASQVDDKTLDIRVHAPERGDWVDVTSLSQGTLDLVYLVARLGLVRLVTGDKRPPLILDDPFVTFDDERAKRSLELLRDVARDFQVIYLTTSDRYDASADAVVAAGRPDRARRRRRLTERDRGRQSRRRVGWGSCPGLTRPARTSRSSSSDSPSAIAFGSGDFGGGWTGRRAPVLGVSLVVDVVGLVVMAVVAIARAASRYRAPDPPCWLRSADWRASSGSSACTTVWRSGGWASSRR